ncbi:MAG: SDR family oxidoreductase [Methanocellales archaeon]|nr:SDR family oxidoreductase [Methanocellales archaeon]
MDVLVTGGAGFIGSHIIDKLLELDCSVICLDNFDQYYDVNLKRRNIEHHLMDDKFKLVEGDIRDFGLLKNIIRDNDIEIIFHEAAQPGVRASVENPSKTHETNATGTLNVLEASRLIDIEKVIFGSSSSVYGKVKYLPLDEKHPNIPISPYGVSKLMAENYCRVYSEIYGLKTTTLRYFSIYGPRMRPDLAISIFTKKALNGKDIEIFGDGEKTRDFTYITDVVDASIKAIEKGDGEIYNIGGNDRVSINELAHKIIDITGSKSKIIHTSPQKGDVEHTWADINKARRALGYNPRIDIDEGLKRYIEWYQAIE